MIIRQSTQESMNKSEQRSEEIFLYFTIRTDIASQGYSQVSIVTDGIALQSLFFSSSSSSDILKTMVIILQIYLETWTEFTSENGQIQQGAGVQNLHDNQ